jgi:hypothetical protein
VPSRSCPPLEAGAAAAVMSCSLVKAMPPVLHSTLGQLDDVAQAHRAVNASVMIRSYDQGQASVQLQQYNGSSRIRQDGSAGSIHRCYCGG